MHIKDAIGRRWQLTTIQIDFAQPNNFSLEYVNSENKKVRPVMIHRALLGSIERFTGILIEHYAGEFPGWLAPNQINILTIGNVDEYLDFIVLLKNSFATYRVSMLVRSPVNPAILSGDVPLIFLTIILLASSQEIFSKPFFLLAFLQHLSYFLLI